MDLVRVKIMTISKKIVRQLDKISNLSMDDWDKIVNGQWKVLGKVGQDDVDWRNGTGWAVVVQKENTACLYPYFSSIREKYPDIKTLIVI